MIFFNKNITAQAEAFYQKQEYEKALSLLNSLSLKDRLADHGRLEYLLGICYAMEYKKSGSTAVREAGIACLQNAAEAGNSKAQQILESSSAADTNSVPHGPGKVTDETVDNIITLNDENGRPKEFEVLDIVKYGGRKFGVLYDTAENDGNVTILELIDDPDDNTQERYIPADEDAVNKVFDIFYRLHKDDFNFDL